MRIMALWLGILGAALPANASGEVREFDVGYGGRNLIRFESSALLETLEGRTGAVQGVIKLDPARVNAGPQARLSVDLTKLETGIAKRDGHMRGPQYLDTAKFPTAVFTITGVKARTADLTAAPEAVKVVLEGTFELHGVTKTISVPGQARYVPLTKATRPLKKMGVTGDALHFRGEFEVTLADYGITVPRFLAVKIADKVTVRVDVFGFAPAP
jgi:polyisoprenoid-binding protein YceI